MAKKRKASSLDTPTCHLATISPTALTTPRRSQRETAVSDDKVESYQLPSHQLELPVVLAQDSIATSNRFLKVSFECPLSQEVIPRYVKCTNSATANLLDHCLTWLSC
jgi:hypothetical protein